MMFTNLTCCTSFTKFNFFLLFLLFHPVYLFMNKVVKLMLLRKLITTLPSALSMWVKLFCFYTDLHKYICLIKYLC